MSREPLRFFESLSYSICQPKLPGTRLTPRLFCSVFCCSPALRCAGDHDLHAPGVYACCMYPVSVGLCVMWLSCHLKLSQSHKSAVSGPPPPLAAPVPERWSPSCASGAVRCSGFFFVKTLVWLEASTAAPSDTEKRGTV